MKYLKCSLILLLFFSNPWVQAAPDRLSSAFIMPGIYLSFNSREGYRKFDNFSELQLVERKPLAIVGLMGGKRFALNNGFRVQAAVELGWGSTAEQTLSGVELTDTTVNVVRYSNILSGGFITDLQWLLPLKTSNVRPFLFAGPGFHGVYLYESEFSEDGKVKILDPQLVQVICASVSINAGTGVEFKLNKRYGAAIIYQFRYWQPIHFTEVRDLFPMGADYKEYFNSHSIQFQLLFPPRKRNNSF